MTKLPFLVFCFLLFHQNLAVETDEAPFKGNLVSNYLDKMLDKIFEKVSKSNLSIPEINLGDDVGRFSEVEGSIRGGLNKKLDGFGSWGFKLEAEVEEVGVGGKYDLVHLDVPLLFPFFGKGRFFISVKVINLAMQLKAVYDFSKDGFDVDIPKFEIVLRNPKVQFENLMNDPSLSDFLNELITNLVPDLVTMMTPPILELFKPTIEQTVNGFLLCIKNESTPDGIEECIRNLLRQTSTTDMVRLSERLRAELKANKL